MCIRDSVQGGQQILHLIGGHGLVAGHGNLQGLLPGGDILAGLQGQAVVLQCGGGGLLNIGGADLTLIAQGDHGTARKRRIQPDTEPVSYTHLENLLTSLNEQYPDNAFAQLSLSNVSAAMGTKCLQKSLLAVVFSLLLILLYSGFRFKKIGGLTGGLMAVLAPLIE